MKRREEEEGDGGRKLAKEKGKKIERGRETDTAYKAAELLRSITEPSRPGGERSGWLLQFPSHLEPVRAGEGEG